MAYVGLFMGGSPHAMIPAGQAIINLQWQAENRQDTPGASFTVSGPGVNQTIAAGTDGRAEILVNVGSYNVSVAHSGQYLGDDPVTVNTESQKSYLVFFDGKVDRSAEINALGDRITSNDNDISSINRTINSYGDSVRRDFTTSVSSGDYRLVTSDAVYQAIINTRELKGTIMIQRYDANTEYQWARLARATSFYSGTTRNGYECSITGEKTIRGERDISAGGVTIHTIKETDMREGVVNQIKYREEPPFGSQNLYAVSGVEPLIKTNMQGTGDVIFEFYPTLSKRGTGVQDIIIDSQNTTKIKYSFRNGVLTNTSLYGARPMAEQSPSYAPDPSKENWDISIRTLFSISVS